MMTSDKEADEFVNTIMKAAELEDTSYEESFKKETRSTWVVDQ